MAVAWAGGSGSWSALFLAQPVPALARPLRQARRHPRCVPLVRLRADLLAVAAQDVEDRLRMPFLRRPSPGRRFPAVIAFARLTRSFRGLEPGLPNPTALLVTVDSRSRRDAVPI